MTGHTALYARVSTDDQSLIRQKEETWSYATETLDVDPSEIEVYADTGTGRDTRRDGYQSLMKRVRAGAVDRVIVLEVSRLSRSMRDLATTVSTVVDESDTGLHVLDMNLALEPEDDDPYQRAFLNIMGTIAQLEADMIRERTRSGIEAAKAAGKHTGRPPFGFDVNKGYLTPNEDYDTAVEILERIEKGESKRSVARFAGVARSTVGRILERSDLYRDYDPSDTSASPESATGD